jgi:Domain of unknown function (DUF5671)
MEYSIEQFVLNGIKAGHSVAELRNALEKEGWSGREIDKVLACVNSQEGLRVPVPRPRIRGNYRNTFWNITVFSALYFVIYNIISILFTYLDYHLPDANGDIDGLFYSASDGFYYAIADSISIIVVALPLYFFLERMLEKQKENVGRCRSFFLSALVFLLCISAISAVSASVYYAMIGDFTLKFLLKDIILIAAAAWSLLYYRGEMKESVEQQ